MRSRSSLGRRMTLAVRAIARWRPSWAWLLGVVRSFLVSFAALAVTLRLLPGEQVSGNGLQTVATLVVTVLVVGALVRPFITQLAVLLGGFGLLVAGLLTQSVVLGLALALVPSVEPFPLLQVFVAAWGVTLVAAVLNWIVDSSSEEVFLAQLLGRSVRLARRTDVSGPGLLVVQLDGVAEPLLRQASASGAVPYLTALLRDGEHRMHRWHTGLPSTTPAGQALLLHGNDTAIPAFRWFDKARGRVLECSRPADAAVAERDFADGTGLLAHDGVSVANLFSGDAPDTSVTMSHARLPGDRGAAAFFTSRTGLFRAAVLLVGQILTELFQGRRQQRRDVVPRVSRMGAFVFLRGLTTVLLRDLSVSIVADQMARGAPVIYVDMLDYDEVAHHAGPTRPESMRTLEGLDRVIRFFAELSTEVGRDYEIAVVSDHGQTQGSTFLQLEGRTLADCVDGLVDAAVALDGAGGSGSTPAEMLGPANLLGSRRGRRRAREAAQPERRIEVVASGSIAHLYLVDEPGRLSAEQVDARQPALVPGLLELPHVGLVLTRRADGVVVVRHRDGWRELTRDGATTGGAGTDPLRVYGDRAAADLVALDAKWHVGDVVVLGRYDPVLGEVCAFEELVGSHGGLGGWQTDALLVAPTHWAIPDLGPEEVLDGMAVHRALLGRLVDLGLRPDPARVTEPAHGSRGARPPAGRPVSAR